MLSPAEWSLVFDALRGTLTRDPSILSVIWAEVADACRLSQLHTKWGIGDPTTLVERLRSLTYGRTIALVDAVERYWAHDPEAERLASQ